MAGIACKTCHHKDCDGSKQISRFKFEDEVIEQCPLTMITHESALLISQYPHYDKGYLPVAGGILDQTAVYVQAMAIISSEINQHREETAEQERRQHGKGR